MNDLTGTTLKGYEVRERIGAGGFGAIYKAFQSTVGREVAIKMILPGLANKPDFIRRFEAEAQLVARLEHLHITPLYDYWRDAEGAYLVMRWLRGGSLKDALQKGPYDLEAAALLLDQICAGLSAAHRNGIVHRDLKPGNILLDEDGNAYIADFGIAKDTTSIQGEVTQPGDLVGSPDYLAPEQARSEPVTPQTDIYSLGVVLYEMLTGEHPFPGLTPVARLYKHLTDPLPLIQSLDPGVVPEINAVLAQATAKIPTRRYPDAASLAAAFREAAQLGTSRGMVSPVELLTPREQEVLSLLIGGKSNREIAERLVVELATIKSYLNQIYRKLNVRSRVQAIVRARELDLIAHPAAHTATTSYIFQPSNPYKGLQAFQAVDERDFFGRERMIARLLSRLGNGKPPSRFLAVVGPSGSGKSSLIKAGLIPALWRGSIPGSERWFIAEMLPGSHPVDELEIALSRVSTNQKVNLGEQLARDERGLARIAQMILPNDASELVLVVDQFEEVFTLVEDEEQRQRFLTLLDAAIREPRSRVRVVVTLRADFYDRPLQYASFGELLRDHTELVLPLSAEELEQAVIRPAEEQRVTFEEGLTAKIVSEVNFEPGALPLLQYALTELFERREGMVLTHSAYQATGGTMGALAKRSEELFLELSSSGQEAARQMFLRLVTLGEGEGDGNPTPDTRRRVTRTELMSITDDPDLLDEIIDNFAAYRLLSLDRDPANRTPTVELAHEAILREWKRLREWLKESRDDIRRERHLAVAAREWDEASHEASFLLTGTRLDQIEEWAGSTELALTPLERDYLAASATRRTNEEAAERIRQAHQTRLQSRSRRVLQGLVGVFLVAALISGGLALWANSERARAEQAEQEALRQASMGLAAQARLETIEGQPERAVLLALEALEHYPYTWQAERALFVSVTENRLNHILNGHTGNIEQIEWSPDSTRFVSASMDSSAIIWDGATGEALLTLQHHALVNDAQWSPDGTRIATASFDGTAAIWDAATGERLALLRGPEAEVWRINWSPDGERVVTGHGDGPGRKAAARIWDAATGSELLVLSGHSDLVYAVTWSPDGARIATASGDSTARVWDAVTGDQLFLLVGHTDLVRGVPWSPDGKRLVTHGDDGQAFVWDATNGERIFTLQGEGRGGIVRAFWSPDGSRLLTTENGRNEVDGVAVIWSMRTGEIIHRLSGGGDLWMGAWSPDGRRVAVHDEAFITRIWDAETGDEMFIVRGGSGIYALDWSPDGKQLVTGSLDGTVFLWDMESLSLLEIPDQYSELAVWSPDGKLIAGAKRGGPLVIMNSETGTTVKTLPAGGSSYIGAGWSPDGTLIVTTQENGEIRIWDSQTGEEQLVFQAGTNQAFLVYPVWSPDGTRIAVQNRTNNKGYVFDANNGRKLKIMDPGASIWMSPLRWSPDGKRLAAGVDPGVGFGEDRGRLFVWDADSGIAEWKVQMKDPVTFADWSPDGERLLVTTFGPAYIVDAETGEILQTYSGGGEGGSWSPDGKRVATGYGLHIWDPSTSAEFGVLNLPAWIAAWSPDGTRILTLGPDGVMRVWRVFSDTQSLIDYANACCVLRKLTPEERVQFGLPERSESGDESSPGLERSRIPVALSFALSLISGGLAVVGSQRLRVMKSHKAESK